MWFPSIRTHIHTYIYTYIHTHTYTHTHTYIYIYIYIYIYRPEPEMWKRDRERWGELYYIPNHQTNQMLLLFVLVGGCHDNELTIMINNPGDDARRQESISLRVDNSMMSAPKENLLCLPSRPHHQHIQFIVSNPISLLDLFDLYPYHSPHTPPRYLLSRTDVLAY